MGRRKRGTIQDPDLGQALQWLRQRAHLTRGEAVAESEQTSEGSYSEVYLRQCEKGDRVPSDEMLERILVSVASNQKELVSLLASPPWEKQAQAQKAVHYRSSTPKPGVYADALPSRMMANLRTEPQSLNANTLFPSVETHREWQELSTLFSTLSAEDQATILGMARSMNK